MNADIEAAKAAIKNEHTAELMRREGLSFPAAWARATREHPDLDEEFASEASAESVYRYDPAKPPAADQAKLDELLSRFMPKKVQAKEPSSREDEGLMLVYAKDGTELGTVYFD